MKHLLNTLYVTGADRYLSLDGENVVVSEGKEQIGRVPLHNLEAIVTFGYQGASPALMGACAERSIDLSFMSHSGRFLARISGKEKGNVLLRKKQYRVSDGDERFSLARNFIIGKVFNAKWVIERAVRDYPMRLDTEKLKRKSAFLSSALKKIRDSTNEETLRGLEGEAASVYFSAFDDLILQQKDTFRFDGRNRRPPTDPVNALLSFSYTLLCGMCAAALESVGLDPYVVFFHVSVPGRVALALDLMEEFRNVYADRFVLTLINKRQITANDFTVKENGAVLLSDEARKTVLTQWQNKKAESITHPFLEEKIEWGLAPYAQALLLARYLRGDLDEYPPFLWK